MSLFLLIFATLDLLNVHGGEEQLQNYIYFSVQSDVSKANAKATYQLGDQLLQLSLSSYSCISYYSITVTVVIQITEMID